MIRWVRQEDPLGCAAACAAMVAGLTYRQVIEAWPEPSIFARHGITHFDMQQFLSEQGIPNQLRYKFELGMCTVGNQKIRAGWPAVFAPAHVIGIDNGRHDVVLLADGTILDPEREQPRRLEEVGDVAFMVGVWPGYRWNVSGIDLFPASAR
jgi:hypothetical protein